MPTTYIYVVRRQRVNEHEVTGIIQGLELICFISSRKNFIFRSYCHIPERIATWKLNNDGFTAS